MRKPGIFYLQFSFDDSDDSMETHAIILSAKAVEMLTPSLESGDFFYDHVSPLEEKYGVHDCGSSPRDEVEGIGYNSYEVGRDQVPKLMHDWRQTLVRLTGEAEVGPVVALGNVDELDDFELYQKALLAISAPQSVRARYSP